MSSASNIVVLDLVGIFVFAISGALVAVRKELDLFGVLVLAGVTGLGGGWLRDVLIDATPPASLMDWRYLIAPVAAGLLTFWFHPTLGRMERSVNVFDAFGLALFCVTGAVKAAGVRPRPRPGRADGHGHRASAAAWPATCSPDACRWSSAASSTRPRRSRAPRWPSCSMPTASRSGSPRSAAARSA